MLKNTKRITALLLALALLCTVAGCKKSNEPISSDVEYVYDYEYVYETEDSNGDTSDKTNSTSNGGGSDKNKGTNDALVAKYKHLKGTTVRFATWHDPELNEDGPVVKDFEKKFNIKVQVDLINQAKYVNTIAGNIAAGNAPDVFINNEYFPSSLVDLQPIDAMKLDLSDPIWDQNFIKSSTINGKAYLVNTIGSVWVDNDMVYYNKKLFKDNNITTPEEYYKSGNWTWDTLEKAMTQVKNLGSEYVGGYVNWENITSSINCGFYKMQNGKFVNGTDDLLKNALTRLATWKKSGLVRGYDQIFRDDFINGKVGIVVIGAYGLRKTGWWAKMNWDNIGFTYMPDYDKNHKSVSSGIYRGYGLCKGAKNPEGAGAFLRYYLDANNYDNSNIFINDAAASFFFNLTSEERMKNRVSTFNWGVAAITGTEEWELQHIFTVDPTQVVSNIDSMQNTFNSDVSKINSWVDKQTK